MTVAGRFGNRVRSNDGCRVCPDHSLKRVPFKMLRGDPAGVTLTESFAMLPTSAVSGFYFGHRDSQYFGWRGSGGTSSRIMRDAGGGERRGRGAVVAAESGLKGLEQG